MSSSFEFNCSGDNWKVDKKSKEYKRLKELFPDCDIILSLDKRPVFENDGEKYPSVLQFLAKDINKPVGEFIFEEPLDDEVYKLVDKLTNKKWCIDIYIIKTYDSEGSTWTATGKITTKGIDWDISQNEDEEQEDEDNSETSLISAAEEGDIKTVKMLLENGADIEAKNNEDYTALIYAARDGHTDMVKLLVTKGADIEAKNDRGVTPLFVAAINGQLDSVKILIEAGANIHVKNRAGKTAQMRAEEQGHTEVVEYLKKYAAGQGSIDSPTKGETERGFAIPKDFDHFHYIACIFKIFADKVGENLSPDVTNKMNELLQEWLPRDLTAPQIFKTIQPKLDELYNHDAGLLVLFLKTATQEIMEAGIFKESNLRSIILDLVDIAETDGEITDNEAKFISRIAQYFGVKFNITAVAQGARKAQGGEGSPNAGEQKNNVDAESCYDKGRQFEKDENYEEAAEWYEKAADQGHVYAQVSLGRAYSEGEGVPENKKEAAKWYEKAARQGDKFAQFCLGNAYSEGEGVPEDKKEAIKWYEKAAKQGYKFGQYSLGNAFYNGEGVPEDKKEAVKWHRKAADQGLDASQLFLGWAYENGEGVPTNHQEALKWYKLAAAQDDKDAQEAISRLSDVNQSDKDDIELVPKGKRVTYSDWSEFEKEQGEKNEQKKNNLPIAKKIHDLMFNVFSEKNKIFEIRYGDGTFSLSIPKDEAKSGKRTFARVGLLSLADKCVYLDTLYRVTGTAIPPGSFTWKKNDDSQFLFRMKTIEDFEKVKNSINQSVIGSYNCLAKTKIT